MRLCFAVISMQHLVGNYDYDRCSQSLTKILIKTSISCGFPLYITSSFRTEEDNKRVKGSSTSSHLSGLAADIQCVESSKRLLIIKNLLASGIIRIGVYPTYLHVDIDPDKPSCLWLR